MADYEETARSVTRYEPAKYARDSARVAHGFWDKVRRTLGQVGFVEDAVAAYYCATDPATPRQVKVILIGALAYFILPSDVVPDILGAFGFFDDAAVLAAAYRKVAGHVLPRHRTQAKRALARLGSSEGGA